MYMTDKYELIIYIMDILNNKNSKLKPIIKLFNILDKTFKGFVIHAGYVSISKYHEGRKILIDHHVKKHARRYRIRSAEMANLSSQRSTLYRFLELEVDIKILEQIVFKLL